MDIKYKIWLENDGQVVFGRGRYNILSAIDEERGLKAAAKKLGMSYRAAWGRLKASEQRLGIQLVENNQENKSLMLTPLARSIISRFKKLEEELEALLTEANRDFIINGMPEMPRDLADCVKFHGHLCPGLVYGYIVAKEAMKLMYLRRAEDEEIVAVCENDSCAVDALQVMLGTSAGKGNLIIKDFGKSVYTITSRLKKKSYRFVRKVDYKYQGSEQSAFNRLEAATAAGVATANDGKNLKMLKAHDILERDFNEIFSTEEISYVEPLFAEVEKSKACDICGEMTMASKMAIIDGRHICIPCSPRS